MLVSCFFALKINVYLTIAVAWAKLREVAQADTLGH